MGHVDIERLADFVRGLGRRQDRAAIERHIAECDHCAEADRVLRSVAVFAAADTRYEPPPHVLRRTRALLAIERPRLIERLPAIVARLVFDSFAQPLPAGVRGTAGLSRQTVYEAGDYAVDVTVEHGRESLIATLVGQVVSREPKRPVAAVPVLLTAGRTVIARTVSDVFGEFLLEYAPRSDLRLQVAVDDGRRRIDIDVSDGKRRRRAPARRRTRSPK